MVRNCELYRCHFQLRLGQFAHKVLYNRLGHKESSKELRLKPKRSEQAALTTCGARGMFYSGWSPDPTSLLLPPEGSGPGHMILYSLFLVYLSRKLPQPSCCLTSSAPQGNKIILYNSANNARLFRENIFTLACFESPHLLSVRCQGFSYVVTNLFQFTKALELSVQIPVKVFP